MEKQQAFIEKEADHRRSVGANASTALFSWLVVGNVSGVYFLLANAADGKLLPNIPYQVAYTLFLVGSAAAFISLTTVLWVNERTKALLFQMFFDYGSVRGGVKLPHSGGCVLHFAGGVKIPRH